MHANFECFSLCTHASVRRHVRSDTSSRQSKIILSQRLIELSRNSTLGEESLREFLHELKARFFSSSPHGMSGSIGGSGGSRRGAA
jgi:hypothetical protein